MKLTLCFIISVISTPALGCGPNPGPGTGTGTGPYYPRPWPNPYPYPGGGDFPWRSGKDNGDREQWGGNLGNVPFDCLTCICQVESNCSIPDPICRGDGTSESCGLYQIKENYWNDGGAIGGSWKACAAERQCSEDTIQGYMRRYATEARLKHPPTCEDFSRIHYGGPTGYKRASTFPYWNKVKQCLDN